MVGVVRQVVIPVKKVGAERSQVFTIVCEVVDSSQPHYHQDHQHHHHHHNHNQHYSEEEGQPLTTRLWKMASAWRVISFFVVVFVLPTVLISLPLYARYHLYHARHMPMTETDTRALNHAVSSFWCQGQRVSSNGSVDAFLVSGAPRVKEQRRHVSLKRNLTLQHDDIEYWGVYLLEGSTFSVSSAARWPGGVMLVVQGEENLRKCFYRETRVQEELQNPGLVYKGPTDQEPDDGKITDNGQPKLMDEERHWVEEDVGGEVFDDYVDMLQEDYDAGIKSQVPQDVDDRNVDDDMEEHTHKYDLERKMKAKSKGKKEKKNKRKLNKNNAEHGRLRRSALDQTEGGEARESLKDDKLTNLDPIYQADNYDMFYNGNETMVVTAGESSYSSSEEFMENCRNALLMIDLNPYPNWDSHISNNDSNKPNTWAIQVNSSDYFYFIFTSDNSAERNEIGFQLDLLRAIYDVSAPIESCRNSTECVFPLAFTQTEAVVVEVPAGEHLHELHSFEVTTACQPRVPVYMVFILLVPFIILLFAFQ